MLGRMLMDISNNWYGFILTSVSLIVAGFVIYVSFKYLRKTGMNLKRVQLISGSLGGIISIIIFMIGIKAPIYLAIPIIVGAVIISLIYANLIIFLRDKIHKEKNK